MTPLLHSCIQIAAGAVLMFLLISWSVGRVFVRENLRRIVFRKLAKMWPDTYEQALVHTQLMNPEPVRRPRVSEYDTLPEIRFAVCERCEIPWVVEENGLLGAHPLINAKGEQIGQCPGSGTNRYFEVK